jgi:hypothetical protein
VDRVQNLLASTTSDSDVTSILLHWQGMHLTAEDLDKHAAAHVLTPSSFHMLRDPAGTGPQLVSMVRLVSDGVCQCVTNCSSSTRFDQPETFDIVRRASEC